MRLAHRLGAMGQTKYVGTTRMSGGRPKWNGTIRIDETALRLPYSWKRGRMIFVNSMSDLFHEAIPENFVHDVFNVMRATTQHTYQVLTKRAERLAAFSSDLRWTENIWMGVSVENADYVDRIDYLRRSKAKTKFLSLEPLLGALPNLDLDGIDWVIAGGESGPCARSMEIDWVRDIRDQCIAADVAFHFKQWGGVNKRRTGRILDGRTWDDFPQVAQR